MDISNVNMESAPTALLVGLRPYLLLDFFDFPYLTVEINQSGSYFLNYYVSGKDAEYVRVLTKISFERLKLFLAGDIYLNQCFDNPEDAFVYYAKFDPSDKLLDLSIIKSEDFQLVNPIPEKYVFDLEVDIDSLEISNAKQVQVKSLQRQRILIDIYLNAPSLLNTLKYWAVKNFLIPFTELVRTSLLNQTLEYTPQSLDTGVNLGFSQMRLNSLYTTIEVNVGNNLFDEPKNIENLTNLFLILTSDTEPELLKSFTSFYNKRIVSEYLNILKVIIKHDASLNTKLATPNGVFFESSLDKTKSLAIKKIIEDNIPNVESDDEIQGTLLELSFNKANPTFAMFSSDDSIEIKGQIAGELVEKLHAEQKEFVFFLKDYKFLIHTVYTPANPKAGEKIQRTLLAISEP